MQESIDDIELAMAEDDATKSTDTSPTYGLTELSMAAAEVIRKSIIILDDMPIDEDVVDVSMKKSAHMLAKNLKAISRMDIGVKTIEEEMEAEKTTAVSIAEGAAKGEEYIRLKRRGTANLQTKRMLLYPRRKGEDSESSRISGSRTSGYSETIEPTEPETVQIEQPEAILSPLEVTAFTCILQECLEQLELIRHEIPAVIDERWDETILSIDAKYGVPDEPQVIFREELGLLSVVPTVAMKIQRERNYISKVLQRTKKELLDHGKYEQLHNEIQQITKFQEDERILENNRNAWKAEVEKVRKQTETEKVTNVEEKKQTVKLAQEINAQVDSVIFLNGSKLGYSQRWENTRLQQQKLRLAAMEQELADRLNTFMRAQGIDRVISTEVCAFLEEDIKNLEKDITMWNNRYNEEITQRQQEIDKLKEKVEEQKIEMQDLYVLRDKYQRIVDRRNAEIERLRAEAREKERIYKAAVTIQSAWRGHMVRHELGPFKNLAAQLKKLKRLALKAKLLEARRRRKKEKEKN